MAGLPVAASVQILDISLSGVLVESSQPTRQGARGHLRVDLGGAPLSADVEVRRVSSAEGTDRYRIGASFVNLSPEQQQLIGRFTTR